MPLAETLLAKFVELVFDQLVKQTGIETRVRDWLGLDPARLAFKRAFTRAYTAFARQYPELTAALFDETFLTGSAAPELAKLLQRDPARPDAVLLVRLWKETLGTRLPFEKDAQLVSAVAAWVRWLETELKSEEALRPVFDSRALEALPKLEEKLDHLRQELERGLALALDKASRYENVTVGGHFVAGSNNIVTSVYNTYFTAGYTTLDDFYIRPDAVFQRVRIENFTGREWLEAEVTQFLEQNRSGVFLLVGDAGVGKTAFMAHLVAKYRFLHLFGEQVRGESNVTRAIESLGVQLVTRYQIQNYTDRNSLPQIAGFPDFLDRLLQTASQERCQGEKIVIVCDALDEAGSGSNGNVLGLPAVLPDGVFLLLSQRPVDVPLHIDVTPHIVKLDAASKENQEDLLAFLNAMARKPAIADHLRARKYSTEEFVTRLAQKSEGIMMYVNYILREIEDGSRYPLDLEQLPVGLVDYYTRYWSNWKAAKNGDSPDWEKICAPLLGILAAAEEPASAEQLAGWGGIDAWEVEKLLTGPWRAFITCQPGKDGAERFSIYHASLRDFLRGQAANPALTPQQQSVLREFKRHSAQAHAKMVAYYRAACEGDWVRLAADDYPRQHLSAHFIGAGQAGVLYALLVQSDAWAKARFHQEGHYDGYRVDLDLLWEALSQQKKLPQMIRIALCKASIVSSSGFIQTSLLVQAVEQLVLPPAVAFIYARQKPDLFDQITAQAAIFASLSKAQQDQFRPLMYECLDHVAGLQNDAQSAWALVQLAPHLPDSLLNRALQAAQTIQNESARAIALGELAPYLPDPLLAQALQSVQTIEDESERTSALAQVAPHLPNDQKTVVLAQALQIIQTIEDESERAIALGKLAPHLSKPLLAQAFQTEQTIQNEYERARALEQLAPYLPEPLLAQALQIIQTIQNEAVRARALGELAPYLSKPLLAQAFQIAQTIQEEAARARALGELAPYLSKPLLAQAFQIAQTIQEEYACVCTLGQIVPHLPDDQKPNALAKALQTAQAIQKGSTRARALSQLAPHLPDDQKPVVLAQALQNVQTIQEEAARASALGELAPYLPKLLLAQAFQIAQTIQEEYARAIAFGELAPHLPDLLLAQALQAAQTIQKESTRARVLEQIVPYLPDDWKPVVLTLALQVAQTIQDEDARAGALEQIAPYLPDSLLAQAFQITQAIKDETGRTRAMVQIAPHLPDPLLAQVLQITQAIKDETERAGVLAQLAPHLQDPLLAQALQTAQTIQNEYERAGVLAQLAPHLPNNQRLVVLAQALQTAQTIQNEYERAGVLAQLAPHLPDSLLAQALQVAQTMESESPRADALTGLAPYLPDPLLAQAFQAAQTIQNESTRAWAFGQFALHLPDDQQSVLLKQALQVTQAIQDEAARAGALWQLAPHLPVPLLAQALQIAQTIQEESDRASTFGQLAPYLPAPLLAQALQIAQTIEDEYERARALAQIAPHLPGEERPVILAQALETTQNIQNEYERARVLAQLAPYLPDSLLAQALQVTQTIQNESTGADVLGELAPYLPDPLLAQAFQAAQTMEIESAHARALTQLAPHLPESLLVQALQAAQAMQDVYTRKEMVENLTTTCPDTLLFSAFSLVLQLELESSEVFAEFSRRWDVLVQSADRDEFSLYTEILRTYAAKQRRVLLEILGATQPIILRIGGEAAIQETAQAILDVGRWWP